MVCCWFSSFWWHFDFMKQVKFVDSRYFLENPWEERGWNLAVLVYPDHLQNCFDFGHDLLIFVIYFMSAVWWFYANLTGIWWLRGATAITYVDLLIFILWYLKKWKRQIYHMKLSSHPAWGIIDFCVVRPFYFQQTHFYLRPVLAFGYCHRLGVCVCVNFFCPGDNSPHVPARIIKFGPKN